MESNTVLHRSRNNCELKLGNSEFGSAVSKKSAFNLSFVIGLDQLLVFVTWRSVNASWNTGSLVPKLTSGEEMREETIGIKVSICQWNLVCFPALEAFSVVEELFPPSWAPPLRKALLSWDLLSCITLGYRSGSMLLCNLTEVREMKKWFKDSDLMQWFKKNQHIWKPSCGGKKT